MRKHLLFLGALLSLSTAIVAQSYTYNGFITYSRSNATMQWETPNTTEGGQTCTSAQGMAVGADYCYVAKHYNNTYADVHRINLNTGTRDMMCYYASLTATKESECNVFGHANELEIVEKVGTDKETWLFVATLKKPYTVARLKVVGDKMYLAGFYEMIKQSDGGTINASALKYVKTVGNDMYFIVKNSRGFYTGVFPLNEWGTQTDPTHVQLYKMFDINVDKAVFATSNTACSHKDGLTDWENQGFGYNASQQVIYVPLWPSASGNQMQSAILTYNVSDYVIDENWTSPRNINGKLYPTKTQFMLKQNDGTFEIETASFRPGNNTTLYFNTNSDVASEEGVYTIELDKTDFSTITLYTIQYNANGGSGTMAATQHVQGVASAISANTFTRSGYTFGGWYLHRQSDDKWLYFKSDGSAGWYKKGAQPVGAYLATRADKHKFANVTNVFGDVITLHAYWKPNTITDAKCFYIRYDANGGTGTMDETKVVHNTSTATAKNAFTREGYTFVGWAAFRVHGGDNQWGYKQTDFANDIWLSGAVTDYILKTYSDGASVKTTTGVDADIITFYAAWAQVVDAVAPTILRKGTDFTLGGKLTCTTDMYAVIARITDSEGTVLQEYKQDTYTARTTLTYATGFDLAEANNTLDFSTLNEGKYIYEVVAQVTSGVTPRSYTVHSSAFTVSTDDVVTDLAASSASTSLNVYCEGDNLYVEGAKAQSVTLYTLTGQQVQTVTNSNTLPIGNLQGVYIVVVTDQTTHHHIAKVVLK